MHKCKHGLISFPYMFVEQTRQLTAPVTQVEWTPVSMVQSHSSTCIHGSKSLIKRTQCCQHNNFLWKFGRARVGRILSQSNPLELCIQFGIYSFGNMANGKEHWLQAYPPLSHFDNLVVRQTLSWSPPPPYFRIHFNRSTDSLMSTSKHHLAPIYIKHICLDFRYLVSEKQSFELGILNSRQF